jgi:hypothetical protein
MENQPDTNTRVQISKDVFDGLEVIKQSGTMNMLDRPVVLELAREWGLTDLAEWIERVDTGTYGQLILQGADIIETDWTTQSVENDLIPQDDEVENDLITQDEEGAITKLSQGIEEEGANLRKVVATLGKQASLMIADTYDTELMGVLIGSPRLHEINSERTQLIRNLAEAASLSLQLEEIMTEVERGIGALQYLIDPENN